jgi:plastocyanin
MEYCTHRRICTLAGGWLAGVIVLLGAARLYAQDTAVSGTVEVAKPSARKQADAARVLPAAGAVVWLTPLDSDSRLSPAKLTRGPVELVQRNKSFEPHVLAVEVGSLVQFPNKDPFFHNVFSLFDGKRFDLGLYEAGSSNSVRFDRPGISYLFCNIHPEMSAVIVAVPTTLFAVTDASGQWTIPNVPNGRYRLHVWYERSSPEDLEKLQRDIFISESSRSLEAIRVTDSAALTLAHKNKYGKDYVPPANPAYSNP